MGYGHDAACDWQQDGDQPTFPHPARRLLFKPARLGSAVASARDLNARTADRQLGAKALNRSAIVDGEVEGISGHGNRLEIVDSARGVLS